MKERFLKFFQQTRTLGFKGLNVVLVFFVAKLYISNISAEAYGQYILYHGYLLTLSTLLGAGNGLFVFRKLVGDKHGRAYSILEGVLITIIGVGFTSLLGFIIIQFLPVSGLNALRLVISLLIYAIAAYNCEVLRLFVRGDGYMLFKDTIRALSVGLVVFFHNMHEASMVILVSGFMSMILSSLYLIFRVIKVKNEMIFDGFLVSEIRQLSKQGLSIGLGKGLQIFRGWFEIFIGGFLFSDYWVAMYSLFLRLAKLVNLPMVALDSDIAGSLAAFTKGVKLSINTIAQIKFAKIASTVFSFAGMLIIVPYIKFYEYEPSIAAVLTCATLILSNMLNSYFGPIGLVAQLAHLKKEFILATVAVIGALALSSFTIVPFFGVLSLAIVSLITKLLWNFFMYNAVVKRYGYKF